MRRRARIAAFALAWAIATAPLAQAQIVRPGPRTPAPREPRRPVPAVAAMDESSDLRARFGVDRAARLVRSSDADERLRGLERAAAIGSPDAVALLADALESTRPTHDDSRARIAIARGLAGHTDQANARTALLLVLGSPAPRRGREGDDPENGARLETSRRIAALALAQSRDSRAVDSLVALARATGPGAPAAIAALGAFPPSGATTAWTRPMTANALRLAARTGDLRALEPALEAARAGDAATRSAAIEALGALGDARVIPIAAAAMGDVDPRMRAAAGAALAALGALEATAAVEQLLADDATAARGIELAPTVHGVGIVRALAARAATAADPAVRGAAVAALGRDPAREAIEALVAFVRDPMLAADAADALARSPSDGARGALEALAGSKDSSTRRLAIRAYVVRALVRGERSGPLDRAAANAAASRDARDRAAGVFARVALGDLDLAAALGDAEPQVRRAAAMASLARFDDGGRARAALLDRLAKEDDAITRRVLAVGLADGDPLGRVPTRTLLACARAGGADAPMCALAFARRADERDAPDVDALLAIRDPVVRAHVARGLALGDDPARAGRLASAYAYEVDPTVRRAIVRGLALGGRDAPAARATLALAARLDPDPDVRWTATGALADSADPLRPSRDGGAREIAWVRLVDSDGAPPPLGQTASLVRADGLAVPIAFDADGDAVVPGVPAGGARLVLAPRLDAAYAPSP